MNVLMQIMLECVRNVYLIGFNQKWNRREHENI